MQLSNLLKLVIVAACFSFTFSLAEAAPVGIPLNPVTDVCWNCIFPIRIGGVTVIPGDVPDTPDLSRLPVCVCPAPPPIFFRPGIPVSFWEPAYFTETVKDPFYFPSLGIGLPNLVAPGFLGGTHSHIASGNQVDTAVFAQGHWFNFPVWDLLELLTDFVCVEKSSVFDIKYLSELDPLWNNDILALVMFPETLLYANPVSQMSCIADSIAANAWIPLSPLYWCMGSWGSAYPLTGHVNDDNYVQANAAIAARMIYKQARSGALLDTAINLCAAVPTPVWVKQNYRLHEAKPVRDITCTPIGRSSLIWGAGNNPPYSATGNSSDNFLWMIFRKRACCAT
ncbi:MAG: TraU family protein [Candidatus Manganitrophaceae bacterium]